jgi:uncharacterized membrane protein
MTNSIMTDGLWEAALWAAAISTRLMAGIYFVFSVFVISALKALPDTVAVMTMNSINRVILKSAFMPLFFCSSLLSLMLIILVGDGSASKWIGAAGTVYLIGMLLCTMLFNVPLNNRLKDVTPENESVIWQYYSIHWTRWNHIRTFSSLLAFILYIVVLQTF